MRNVMYKDPLIYSFEYLDRDMMVTDGLSQSLMTQRYLVLISSMSNCINKVLWHNRRTAPDDLSSLRT